MSGSSDTRTQRVLLVVAVLATVYATASMTDMPTALIIVALFGFGIILLAVSS